MTERFSRFDLLRKGEQRRFAVAIVIAGGIWCALLMRSLRLFAGDEPAARAPETIQMQVVELPPPAHDAPPVAHAGAKAQPLRNVAPKPETKPETKPEPKPEPVPRPAAARPTRSVEPEKRTEATPAPDTSSARQPSPPAPAQTGQATADLARSASAANAEPAASHTAAAGNTQARLISRPLPTLPDDLREQGYQTMAVARFVVHADGTFDIDLVKPTSNPRLNQILLDTLRQWRFFPAMENGRPVESRQDVRVHFNVN